MEVVGVAYGLLGVAISEFLGHLQATGVVGDAESRGIATSQFLGHLQAMEIVGEAEAVKKASEGDTESLKKTFQEGL